MPRRASWAAAVRPRAARRSVAPKWRRRRGVLQETVNTGKIGRSLTLGGPPARTTPHPSWIFRSPGSYGPAERWPSGRRRRFAKPLMGVNPIRGFESLPLRHSPCLKRPIYKGFEAYRAFPLYRMLYRGLVTREDIQRHGWTRRLNAMFARGPSAGGGRCAGCGEASP